MEYGDDFFSSLDEEHADRKKKLNRSQDQMAFKIN